jgi:hypothetical protein
LKKEIDMGSILEDFSGINKRLEEIEKPNTTSEEVINPDTGLTKQTYKDIADAFVKAMHDARGGMDPTVFDEDGIPLDLSAPNSTAAEDDAPDVYCNLCSSMGSPGGCTSMLCPLANAKKPPAGNPKVCPTCFKVVPVGDCTSAICQAAGRTNSAPKRFPWGPTLGYEISLQESQRVSSERCDFCFGPSSEGTCQSTICENGPNKMQYAPMPNPTPQMHLNPIWNAIWDVIKTWDVSIPGHYDGYMGANGSHATMIFNALLGFDLGVGASELLKDLKAIPEYHLDAKTIRTKNALDAFILEEFRKNPIPSCHE